MLRRSTSRRVLVALVLTGTALFGVSVRTGAEPSAEQRAAYNQLRRDYFIVLALPPQADGRPRREHVDYARRVGSFVESLGDAQPLHRGAALYFRGRLYLRLKHLPGALSDFDACLATLDATSDADATMVVGLPDRSSIQMFRAFTFLEENPDAVLRELEAIPDTQDKPTNEDARDLLERWAETLARADHVDAAIRAYAQIKRLECRTGPAAATLDKQIELLKMRHHGGGMGH